MHYIPSSWMPEASMVRVITHWTAGNYNASPYEKLHYHILIDGEGGLHRGTHSIKDNEVLRPGKYAAHTSRTNTQAIGVTVCCMSGATKTNFGKFPMKELQWDKMVEVVGVLCDRYEIPVTGTTVLGHGEVERKLGIPQGGKPDPMILPWDPKKDYDYVGNMFRYRVRFYRNYGF